MTRDEIIEMARQAGFTFADEKSPLLVDHGKWQRRLCERFAALVAAAEREACAKVCEGVLWPDSKQWAQDFAAAIRARGEK